MNNSKERKARRIASLLAGYIRDSLTPAEHDELDEWVGASDRNMRLFEELTDEKRIELALELLNDKQETGLLRELQEEDSLITQRHSFPRRFNRYAVAASFVLIAGTAFFFVNRNLSRKTKAVVPVAQVPVTAEDITPAVYKATITLDDRSVIDADKVNEGIIATQGISSITKQDGQLTYAIKPGQIQNTQLQNTVTTPKGGKIRLNLSDGSKLWLNAASSVSYPAVFTGKERRIAVTGEVYLEVASAKTPGPNYGRRFIVEVKDKNMVVEVLGTHFSITAYKDEADVKTALLEGAVKVTVGEKTRQLKPNQQAVVTATGEIAVHTFDNNVIGWKDGIIQPKGAAFRSVMNEIGRWYNVEIVFEDNNNTISTRPFSSTLNLNGNLLKTINKLKETEKDLSFRVEGRKIIVTPS
jgi:transmembrane sensor